MAARKYAAVVYVYVLVDILFAQLQSHVSPAGMAESGSSPLLMQMLCSVPKGPGWLKCAMIDAVQQYSPDNPCRISREIVSE